MTEPTVPDWQPTIQGARVLLEPLQAGDFETLYAVASDPLIWEQHPEPTRWQREVFTGALEGRMQNGKSRAVCCSGHHQPIPKARGFCCWA